MAAVGQAKICVYEWLLLVIIRASEQNGRFSPVYIVRRFVCF